MKILSINLGNLGSTGKIASGIYEVAKEKNIEYKIAYPAGVMNLPTAKDDVVIGTVMLRRIAVRLATYTGFNGCTAWVETYSFLKKLDEYHPDVIHLHNLHHSYINIPMLFNYIKKHKIKVVWTLHDCWSFTGQCPHFDLVGCDKWKMGCYNCPQIEVYPQAWIDLTKTMWHWKREWFNGVDDLMIVTPSQWLADLVKQSFLKKNPVKVINNGIDLEVFRPTESDFREKYNLNDKKIVLGVAFGWGIRKGLDVFISLAKSLPESYQIVLVGTDNNVEKHLPKNIISIQRTNNQKELAEIYTVADVFVNPTREDNYPTVNMEAIACGTPVITFNTGGSPEIIDVNTGCVVEKEDLNTLEKEIIRICETQPYTVEDCLERAKSFDMNERFKEYVRLYEELHTERLLYSGSKSI